MAIQISPPMLGNIRGKVGNVIVSVWNNIVILKKTPTKLHKKELSPTQTENTSVFGTVSSFFKSAGEVIRLGYQLPRNARKTSWNAVVSYHLDNAVTTVDEEVMLDLSKIRLSKPLRKTQQAWNPVLAEESGYKITVTWEHTPDAEKCTRMDDKVVLVCYDAKLGRFLPPDLDSRRSDLSCTIEFFDWYTGHELYWYLFMVSADGKLVSETEYLGMVMVKA